MDTTTLASFATQQAIKTAISNIRKNSILLILSFTSTLFLLGITIFSNDYLSRTNREFATKIFLFLTGVSTAVTIHLIDKGINNPTSQAETLEIDDIVSGDKVLPSSSANEVVVIEPGSFEEIPGTVLLIQQGKSVVLNLNVLDEDIAQRAVDFVAGGTYGMNGQQERIGQSIFLFTPSSVPLSTYGISKQEISLSNSELNLTSTSTPRRTLPRRTLMRKEETQAKLRKNAG